MLLLWLSTKPVNESMMVCKVGTYLTLVFDKVTVLYEGRQIYFGRGEAAKQYFIEQGWECLDRQTTADFLTAVTGTWNCLLH